MRLTKILPALTVLASIGAVPAVSHAGVFIGISIAPPAIPVYVQPVAPAPDMLWTPGYWQWDASVGDYFWVPGVWAAPPQTGFLWTPGYWGYTGGYYGWNAGYWGPHIGYYGGVNYGFGFFGRGYEGGYWNNNHFFYNTAYSNVNVNVVHNTYIHNTTIINNVHTSYVGGQGGLQNRPTAGEQAAFRENHVGPTQNQVSHVNFARQDRSQFAQQNHGNPAVGALSRPVNSQQSFRQASVAPNAGGGFTNNGQRGLANTQPNFRPANSLNNNAAAANRGAIGNANVQADRQNVQQQRFGDQQQVMQQRGQDMQQRQALQNQRLQQNQQDNAQRQAFQQNGSNQQQRQAFQQQQLQQRQQDTQQRQQIQQGQQQQRLQDRQQVQQQRQGDRQQVQQQRQESRPSNNNGGNHEDHPRR